MADRNNNGLYFIVGGIVVVVALLFFFMSGSDTGTGTVGTTDTAPVAGDSAVIDTTPDAAPAPDVSVETAPPADPVDAPAPAPAN